MGNQEVIDLCSDSDADSWDGCYQIASSPEASPVKVKAETASASTKTNTTTSSTRSTKLTLTVTNTTVIPPAPIFSRNVVALPNKRAKTKATDDMLVAPRPKTTTIKSEPDDVYANSSSSFSLLEKLNSAQRRAVTSDANTVAILAGPGSGKTHTLTSRVAWLIDQVGYTPSNVIVATFTVKAAREMKERIGKVLGGGREKRIVLGTFHSVSLRYLSAYGTRIGLAKGFSIVDDNDSKSIIKRIVKRLNLEMDTAMARGWISKKKSKGCLGTDEENKKKNGKESAENKDFLAKLTTIYNEYQKHLESLNLLDYDDLLIRCTELLRAHPACVANVQAVLIDEYQDTNGIQFELMKLFAQSCNRITVVGDPDQSIYGWRSAEITNLTRFLSDFPRTAEIALEENYRSSQCILSTSLQVIQQDQDRYDKSLLPVHKKGTLPVLRRLQDSQHEAMWIIQEIRRATLLTGNMLNHGDIAILVRSAALSRPIEQALARAAIPYRMIGGRKFFERAEVKLLVDYLRVIHQPHNNEVLARIINVPRRGVGPKTIKGCLEEAETGNMSFWTLITKHCRGDIIAKTGINATTTKKIGRFIDLVQRMQGRLRGALEELGQEDGEDDNGDEEEEDHKIDVKSEALPKKKDAPTTTITSTGIITDTFTTTEPGKPYDLVQLITALTEQLNYRNYIGETYGGDEEARWANIDEFVTLAREFMNNAKLLMVEDELPMLDGIEQTKETDVLNKFLANISLAADADKKQEGTDEPLPMVTISTIHAAKGLEWPVVFIPAAYEGSLPHSRSDDTNEERRLLYVAMTRAKCLLNVSYSLYGSPDRDSEREGRRSEQSLSPFLADIVDVWFAECGPAYDRALLDEMGDILGRPVPKERAIYKDLPSGVPIEDNVLPIDPLESSRYHNEDEDGGYEYSSRFKRQNSMTNGSNNAQQNSKRRRMMNEMPNYSGVGGGGGDSQGPWQRGYTTTMEGGSSNFTMGGGAAYPGFTTASVHRTAMLEAEAAEAAEAAKRPPPIVSATAGAGEKRKRGAALPTGQQTIMQSFIRSNSTGTTTEAEKVAARASGPPPAKATFQRSSSMFAIQHQQQHQLPAVPSGIPAELKSRSLGGVRGNLLPAAGAARGPLTKATPADKEKRRYAHFSSSPPPAEEPKLVVEAETEAAASEPMRLPQIHPQQNGFPPPQAKQQQQYPPPHPQPYNYNHPRPYRAPQRPAVGGKENLQTSVVQAKSTGFMSARPAASFHTTTYAQVQAHGSVSTNIRPAGGGPGGGAPSLAPMDRLRRPFKPPTIRRPQ